MERQFVFGCLYMIQKDRITIIQPHNIILYTTINQSSQTFR